MGSETQIQIGELCHWSEARRVETKHGPRDLRKAVPSEDFWKAWESDKQTLKDAGVSVSRDRKTGEWEACWWLPATNTTVRKLERLALNAHHRGVRFTEFWPTIANAVKELEPWNKAAYHRLHDRLMHLTICGNLDGQHAIGDLDIDPWILDDQNDSANNLPGNL